MTSTSTSASTSASTSSQPVSAQSTQEPTPGTVWKHYKSNNLYVVIFIGNDVPPEEQKEKYPKTIVYIGENGKIWCGRADDWHRRMIYVGNKLYRFARP